MLKLIINPTTLHPYNLGWEDPLSAGIGVVGSVISGAISNNANKKAQQRQNRWQHQERLETQEYNTSERLASQDWQNQQRIAQNKYAEDQYNAYSSPQALARQYEEAGLNSRLAMDGSGVGNVTAGAGSSGSAPSGSNAGFGSGAMPAYQPMETLSRSFSGIADGIRAISEAKKAGIDTRLTEESLSRILRQYDLEAENTIADTAIKQFMRDKVLPLNNEKATKEIAELVVKIKNGELEGEQLRHSIEAIKKENHLRDLNINTFMEGFNNLQESIKANTANTIADTSVKRKSLQVLDSQIRLNDSYSSLNSSQKTSIDKSLGYLDEQMSKAFRKLDDEHREKVEDIINRKLRNINLGAYGSEELGKSVVSDIAKYLNATITNPDSAVKELIKTLESYK